MATTLRTYGAATTVVFPLVDRGTLDFEATPVTFAAADTQVSQDEGAFANTGSTPAHEGNGMYSLALTAAEMQGARIMVTCIDSATKLWEDTAIIIETIGHPSAQHPDRSVPGAFQTTIATLATQISFTLTAGSADNDAYNGWQVVVADATTANQVALGVIDDYVGSTNTVTLREDPGIFTMATSDVVTLVPKVSSDLYAIDGDAAAAGNLETAADNYSATRGLSGTALPAAAADAAGGLAISDAGGLDLDATVGAMTYTVANQLDANVQSINDAGVVGDGNATPWDGA